MKREKQQQSSFDIRFQKKIENGQLFEADVDVIMIIIEIIFKILVIVCYFTLGDFYVLDFLTVIVLTSIDFWIAKNITGRKLVGLRWWIQINQETGQELWVFQSCNPHKKNNNINENVFWAAQFIVLIFWAVMIIINLLVSTLFWIGLSGFCFLLFGINFHCYYKCRGTHQQKLNEFMNRFGINTQVGIIEQVAQVTQQ